MRQRVQLSVGAMLAATSLLLIAGCGESKDGSETKENADSTGTEEVAITSIAETGAQRIRTREGDHLASSNDSIWLSSEAWYTRIDLQTGREKGRTDVPEIPCLVPDSGFGAVWTATCRPGGLSRIEPASGEVVAHEAVSGLPALEGANGSISAGEGGIWLVVDARCEDCKLVSIDPNSLRVTAEVPVEAGSAGVRAGAGAVWVSSPSAGLVQKVDPDAGEVVEEIAVEGGPRYVAIGEGAIWTLNEYDGSVSRIDPKTNEVVATITAPVLAAGEPGVGDIATGEGSIWVHTSETLLARIDPATNEVTEAFGPPSGGGQVIVAGGAVWVSAYDKSVLWRLPLAD